MLTEQGVFRGVLGDASAAVATGSKVTLSVRPEAWRWREETTAGENRVRGVIGSAVFLGEVAQYEIKAGALRLKILELNPPPVGAAVARGEVTVSVRPEDVVVLTS